MKKYLISIGIITMTSLTVFACLAMTVTIHCTDGLELTYLDIENWRTEYGFFIVDYGDGVFESHPLSGIARFEVNKYGTAQDPPPTFPIRNAIVSVTGIITGHEDFGPVYNAWTQDVGGGVYLVVAEKNILEIDGVCTVVCYPAHNVRKYRVAPVPE